MRAYALEGRFIFEDKIFYENFYNNSPIKNLFFLFNGHLELPTNLVIQLSQFSTFLYAPLFIVWLSFILQSIPVLLLILYHRRIGIGYCGLLICILGYVGLTQSTEVWANAVNLHFHFACTAALLLVIPSHSPPEAWGFRFLVLISGLSGIPANFLLPMYIWEYLKSRDKNILINCLILAITTTVQLSLIVSSSFEVGNRTFLVNPLFYILPAVPQVIISQFFGNRLGEISANYANNIFQYDPFSIAVTLSLFAVFLYSVIHVFKKSSPTQKTLLFSAITLYSGCIFSSLGDKTDLISTGNGLRYFFASNIIGMVFTVSYAYSHKSKIMFLLLIAFVINCSIRVNQYFGGPPWRNAYLKAMSEKSMTIPTWPYGWGEIKNFDQLKVRN